ncbi:ASCH domain-containing protein [Natrialbaceae archaeon A-gly3]
MTEIDVDTLLPSDRMIEGALEGDVTQIHRGQQYAEEGDTFEVEGETFEVVEVTDRTLGALTDDDARSEGMRDLDQYKDVLERAHDDFEWDDNSEIVLHRFERR